MFFQNISCYLTKRKQIPIASGGTTWAWSSPIIIAFFTIGGVLAVSLIIWEWKIAKFPVMPMRLFEKRAAKILFMHNFITGIVYYSDLYYLPLYFQVVRGHSPLTSGLLILPLILGFSAFSTCGGFLLSKLGRCNPVIWAGYVLWTAGAGGHIAFGSSTPIGVTIGCLLIEGFGLGWAFQPVMIALLANTRKEDRAVVTGLRNFLRTVGGAVGLAVCAAILNNVLKADLPEDLASQKVTQLISNMEALPTHQQIAIKTAYMNGLKIIFYLACPLMGFCLLTSLFVADVELATAHEKQKEPETSLQASEPEQPPKVIDVEKR